MRRSTYTTTGAGYRTPRDNVQNLSHFQDWRLLHTLKEQPMSDEKPMGQVIQIDEARIRDHLGEMVRGTVEETLCPSSDDLRLVRRFAKRGSGSSGVRLGGLQPVLQATVCNSLTLDTLTLSQDCLCSAEVDVSRRDKKSPASAGVLEAVRRSNLNKRRWHQPA